MVLLWLVVPPVPGWAGDRMLVLRAGQDRNPLGPHISVMKDPTGRLTIAEAASPAYTDQYRPYHTRTINLGVADEVYWLRFSVREMPLSPQEAGRAGPWMLDLGNHFVADTRLYVPIHTPGRQGWFEPRALDRMLNQASMPHLLTHFCLPWAPGTLRTMYLRLQPLGVTMMVPEISRQRTIASLNARHTLLFGAYCGTILALAFYNLFLFITVRDSSYLWYVLTIGSSAILHLGFNGFFTAYFPDLPPPLWVKACLFFLGLGAMFRILFARGFLLVPENAPWINRILWIFFGVFAVLALASWHQPSRVMVLQGFSLAGLVFPFVLVTAGLSCWQAGFKPAKFFVIPYLITALGTIGISLATLGLTPFASSSVVLHQVGAGVEAVLLSVALGFRIRTLQREKERIKAAKTQAQEALKESEAKSHWVMESVPDPLVVCDLSGKVAFVNNAFTRVFGWGLKDLAAKGLGTDLGEGWEGLTSGGRPWYTGLETRLEARDGRFIPVGASAAAILDSHSNPKGVVLTLQDITRRKRTEEELRHRQALLGRLARQLSISEEGQRRAIAEDLHDSVTQLLGISLFRLRNLGADLAAPHQAAEADQICRDLDQALTHTRTLTIEISPPSLYDLGLGPALEWLAENMQERWGLEVEYKWDGSGSGLNEDIRIALYRSTRELLINVHKHAGVQRALLEVLGQDGRLSVSVSDRGGGFSPREAASCQTEDGFGLFSIRERLELLGGEMEIKTAPGQGCCITLYAPLTGPERKEARCP